MNLLQFAETWMDEVVISSRLTDENGNPIKFKISSMALEQCNDYRNQASSFNVKKKDASFSAAKYQSLVIINHTWDPSFKDAAALKEGGFLKPEQYLNAALKAGEAERRCRPSYSFPGLTNLWTIWWKKQKTPSGG